MWTILGDLAGALLKWLLGRWLKPDPTKAANAQAKAEAQAAEIQTQTENKVEQARATNDQAIDKARADAAGPDGLRNESNDVNAAVAEANRELR